MFTSIRLEVSIYMDLSNMSRLWNIHGIPDQSAVKYSWYQAGHHPLASTTNSPTVSEYDTEKEMKTKMVH